MGLEGGTQEAQSADDLVLYRLGSDAEPVGDGTVGEASVPAQQEDEPSALGQRFDGPADVGVEIATGIDAVSSVSIGRRLGEVEVARVDRALGPDPGDGGVRDRAVDVGDELRLGQSVPPAPDPEQDILHDLFGCFPRPDVAVGVGAEGRMLLPDERLECRPALVRGGQLPVSWIVAGENGHAISMRRRRGSRKMLGDGP